HYFLKEGLGRDIDASGNESNLNVRDVDLYLINKPLAGSRLTAQTSLAGKVVRLPKAALRLFDETGNQLAIAYGAAPGGAVGAADAIAAHPTDPNVIFVGGVNGGIWKSADGGSTWTPKTDFQKSLSISSISFDRSDTTKLVAGVGLFSSYRNDGGARAGILRS